MERKHHQVLFYHPAPQGAGLSLTEQAIKETFKEHLLKKVSDTTGVNIYDLRHSSKAKTYALLAI